MPAGYPPAAALQNKGKIVMIQGIDHIGIAVKSINEAKKFWGRHARLKNSRTSRKCPSKKSAWRC